MAKISAEIIEKTAKEAFVHLEDGFQWTDLFAILPKIIEIVEDVKELSEEEKRETAIELINHLIDETDTPWVPDSVVDPILKKATPFIVDMAIDAYKNKKED